MGIPVLFVYPDFVAQERTGRPGTYDVETGGWYAEGLAAMSASLRAAGHHPSLMHLTVPPDRDEFTALLRQHNPALVAFTVRSSTFPYCLEYTQWVKEGSGAYVIWGGYHPTLAPEECLEVPGVDSICVGEGDWAIVDLADVLPEGKEPVHIESLWFNTASGPVRNPVRPMVENLDELPIPDFELFDRRRLIATRTGVATAMLSRGCPFRCGYCSNHRQRAVYPNSSRYARCRSPRNSIEYLRRLRKWFPEVRELRFLDNVFGLGRMWLEEFCELYRREIGLPFSCNQRPDLVTRERLALVARAGCRMIYMGIESGDEEVRRLILDRRISDERLKEVFRACREMGIATVAYNMVGLPGEDRKKVLATVKMNAVCRPASVVVSVFSPYPGTDLYDLSVKKGYAPRHMDYRARTFLDQPNFSKQEVALVYTYFMLLVRLYRLAGAIPWLGQILVLLLDRFTVSVFFRWSWLVTLGERGASAVRRFREGIRRYVPWLYRLLRAVKMAVARGGISAIRK
ncbi:MAG: radical SAM protein [Firmicutes bacterium]|nr:radical SAM protein [Candidatus Fermentithermobacillaceae bacterium]